MENKTCGTCKHFLQHYSKSKEGYQKVSCGHCTHPRVKKRNDRTPACQNYQEPKSES